MKRILTTLKEKWPEYLLEIFVITIGILGAFALNSWNEKRDQRIKESSILREINFEFEKNRELFDEVKQWHLRGEKSSKWLLDKFPFTSATNQDSLVFHFVRTFSYWTFEPSSSNIDIIINTESFDIIQDVELRKLLIRWDNVLEDYKEEELRNVRNFDNVYLPFLRTRIDLFEVNRKGNLTYQDFDNSIETKNVLLGRYRSYANIVTYNEAAIELETMIDRIIELTEIK